ncbi:hypothetical protein ABBQ38_011533 [Trebouxia sp. C0009 RCD-2024]
MLVQAGVKDGAKLSIAETTAYREHQAQAQALQEQEAMTQRQQAQAVQQEIREQQTMKLQVEVITAQVNQLAEQAQQLQQHLHQQDPAISYKDALRLGEALTQKLIQLDNVQVTGLYHLRRLLL